MKNYFVAVAVLLCWQASTVYASLDAPSIINQGTVQGFGSLGGSGSSVAFSASGDFYGADPLVQDSANAYYISSSAGTATFTFDSFGEIHGSNLAGNARDGFVILEAETDLGSGRRLIQTEIVSLDLSNGFRTPWVAAGVGGGALTTWRIDIGDYAAVHDRITLDAPWTVLQSGFTAFDLTGSSLGSFELTIDSSDATGLSGVGVAGLGGADIAGFGLSSMQMFWVVQSTPEPGTLLIVVSLFGVGAVITRRCRR